MEFEAWIKDSPTEKVSISIDIENGKKTGREKIVKSKVKKIKQTKNKKVVQEQNHVRSRPINHQFLTAFFSSIQSTGKPDYTKLTEDDIINAKNIEAVIKSLLRIQKKSYYKISEKIFLILGKIVSNSKIQMNYPKSVNSVLRDMMRYVNFIQNLPNPNPKEINLGVRYAIETIGKAKTIDLQRNVVKSLTEWVENPIFRGIRNAILISMGKLPADSEILSFLVDFISRPQKKDTIVPAL